MTIPPARVAPFTRVDLGQDPAVLNAIGKGLHVQRSGTMTFDVPLPASGSGGSIPYLQLSDCGFLGTLDQSGNTTLLQANVSGNAFTAMTFAGCSALTTLAASNCNALTTVDLSGCAALVSADFNNCGALEGIGAISDCASLLFVRCQNAAITDTAAIDAILITLDEFGLSGGTLLLDGGTNAAPGPDGLAAKASLEGKDWTVNVNVILQFNIFDLGLLVDGTVAIALAVSADGPVVVGYSNTTGGLGNLAVFWANGDPPVLLDLLAGGTTSTAYGVSGTGTVIVGSSNDTDLTHAVAWVDAGPAVDLGFLAGGTASTAYAISVDGHVIVGISNATDGFDHAVSWTDGAAPVGLDFLPGGSSAFAAAVSGDGSVIVGTSNATDGFGHAVSWTNGGSPVALDSLPGSTDARATGVSPDGTVIVGWSNATDGFAHAVAWVNGVGPVDLGSLSGDLASIACGVSSDNTIVGISERDADRAVRWAQISGITFAAPVELVGLTGWINVAARAITSNGLKIVGSSDATDTFLHPVTWIYGT